MKRSLPIFLLVTLSILLGNQIVCSQDSVISFNKQMQIPDKLFKKLSEKSGTINNSLTGVSARCLRQMAKDEKKLRGILSKMDPVAAEKMFGDAERHYAQIEQQINNISARPGNLQKRYFPHLDSLQTALKFLEGNNTLLSKNYATNPDLKDALNQLNLLQTNFTQAENIRQFVQQREQFLQDRLGKYGFANYLKKIKQRVYYYQAQVESYRQSFNHPSKIESGALLMLKNTTRFKNFFQQHSQLAALFIMPASSAANSPAFSTGLQTHDAVQQQLLQTFGFLPDIEHVAVAHANGPQSQLNQLKNKTGVFSSGNEPASVDGFTPNNQKTMSIIKRIEFGANLQTVKSTYFFPATTDVALSIGYKLNDKSIVGVGGSYKMGWGRDIRHVTITSQGVGIRSFIDFRIKGDFWLSGGGEMNYKSQFKNFKILDDYSPWQKSALLGLSKKYRVTKKLKGNMQLMYDFLSKQQIPKTQPVVFRIGYLL